MPLGSRPIHGLVFLAIVFAVFGAPARAASAKKPLDLRGSAEDPATPSLAFDAADPMANQADENDKLKPRKPPRLPPLAPYRRAQRLDLRGGPTSPRLRPANATPAPTIAAIPAPAPLRGVKREEDPYAPLGIRVGDLKLTPYVEEDVGFATNPTSAVLAKTSSVFETTEAGLGLQSDWSRHSLNGQARVGYTDYFKAAQPSGAYGSGNLAGRWDVSKDLAFDALGRFSLIREPVSSLGVTTATGAIPDINVAAYGAAVGAAQKFGDLTLALHGSLDRTAYQDLAVVGAGVANHLSTDDFNDWGLRARASYRLSEAVSPFVEYGLDIRRYDATTDTFGYARNSTGSVAKAGVTLAFSQLLSGEASFGFAQRKYQDARLISASAGLIDASLIWKVSPLTTVTANVQSRINDSVLAGASANINRSYTLEIAHALTRQIKLGLIGGYATDNYIGVALTDASKSIGVNGEYHLNRDVVLKASATHQQYSSNTANSTYSGQTYLLGVRLQR